jgi:hypothetical protein
MRSVASTRYGMNQTPQMALIVKPNNQLSLINNGTPYNVNAAVYDHGNWGNGRAAPRLTPRSAAW